MSKFNQNKEVLSFHMYMWNKWSKKECEIVFGDLADHIWDKWVYYCAETNSMVAPALMVMNVDEDNLDKLINRACELYDGRKSKNK